MPALFPRCLVRSGRMRAARHGHSREFFPSHRAVTIDVDFGKQLHDFVLCDLSIGILIEMTKG